MGTIQIDGSTPKLTIGNATAEDALILFDGNAQDFYIALDDSADDLLIGLGSTVGTTPAISIDENLKVAMAADATVGDDLTLLSDSSVLGFGADTDTTLTHTDGTGLTLNSTNKLCFYDSALSISSSTDGQLDIDADTEVEITTTTVDLNGALDVSGNSQFSGTVTVGVDDTGKDVKFFGASAGAYMEWDESADQLRIMGASADATTSTGKLLLATSLTDINANDVIGKIDFQAPHEAGGTDAITVAASIQAIAQGTFSSSVNATDLIFYTGHSEAAAEKIRITSQNEIGIAGANYGTDGQVLTSGGAGAAVAWEDVSGGKVIASYAVQGYGDVSSGTSSSWVQVQNQTLTPASANSKFLLMLSHTPHTNDTSSTNNQGGRNGFRRAISGGATTDFPGNSWYAHDTDVLANFPASFHYLDSPSTTSDITYSTQYMRSDDDGYTFYQHNQLGSSTSLMTFIILELSS